MGSTSTLRPIAYRFQQMGQLTRDDESAWLRRLTQFSMAKYLDLLAYEEGQENWKTLTKRLRDLGPSLRVDEDTELYRFNACEFNLNIWFHTYDEARAYLDSHRGFFLLQYKGQCFLAQAPHILDLGLDPKDPDWKKIGWDWVHPKDPEAKARLREKLRQASGKDGC